MTNPATTSVVALTQLFEMLVKYQYLLALIELPHSTFRVDSMSLLTPVRESRDAQKFQTDRYVLNAIVPCILLDKMKPPNPLTDRNNPV
jgi:hypothetical protein